MQIASGMAHIPQSLSPSLLQKEVEIHYLSSSELKAAVFPSHRQINTCDRKWSARRSSRKPESRELGAEAGSAMGLAMSQIRNNSIN